MRDIRRGRAGVDPRGLAPQRRVGGHHGAHGKGGRLRCAQVAIRPQGVSAPPREARRGAGHSDDVDDLPLRHPLLRGQAAEPLSRHPRPRDHRHDRGARLQHRAGHARRAVEGRRPHHLERVLLRRRVLLPRGARHAAEVPWRAQIRPRPRRRGPAFPRRIRRVLLHPARHLDPEGAERARRRGGDADQLRRRHHGLGHRSGADPDGRRRRKGRRSAASARCSSPPPTGASRSP
jgi:hypothetical protein